MNVVFGILLFFLFVYSLIRGWIWIVNLIMNPKIKAAEKKREEALKKNEEYQMWLATEKNLKEFDAAIKEAMKKGYAPKEPAVEQPENTYIAKHFRIIEGHRQAEELRKSFRRGFEDLKRQYKEYLQWCRDNNIKPVVPDPYPEESGKDIFKVYEIN